MNVRTKVGRIFQFHKGTIKTLMSELPYTTLDGYFNSIKVRLKQQAS